MYQGKNIIDSKSTCSQQDPYYFHCDDSVL